MTFTTKPPKYAEIAKRKTAQTGINFAEPKP